jgi:hypothetical protein
MLATPFRFSHLHDRRRGAAIPICSGTRHVSLGG